MRTYTGKVTKGGTPDVRELAGLVITKASVGPMDNNTVGDVSLSVIHLVGHTPGSVALVYDDPSGNPHLFTGDCLFPGGVGSTTFDTERPSLAEWQARRW